MTRKQVALVMLVVVAASGLSAWVAYRRGLQASRDLIRGRGPAKSIGACVDFTQAGDHTGETACVTGRVLRVFTSRSGNTFLDFCADYRHCPFTSVIFASDHDKFGNLESLAGRTVELRGAIVPYQGHAEIVVHDPEQIHAEE